MAKKKKAVEEVPLAEVPTAQYEPGFYDSPIALRRGQRFSKKAVARALHASNGLVSVAARKMQCSVGTVRNYLKRYPELQDELQEIRDSYIDLAESSLLKQIHEKNTAATIFLLKCLGKSRGWIESPNVNFHAHVDGAGTWADIMKRVASQYDGKVIPTKEEIARVIDVTPSRIKHALPEIVVIDEPEDEDGEDE